MKDPRMEIALLIGQPINTQMPVPFELAAIADTFTAAPGEHVWRYSTLETTADVVLAVDGTDGAITVVKRSPLDDVELTFSDLNSKLEYVLLTAVLGSPDTDILSRRRESITRGMDKREVQIIIGALEAETGAYMPGEGPQTYTPATADDLWDCIVGMKHLVEDYGDGYVLLCGTAVKEAIDTYDKDNVASFNYRIGLKETLNSLGIEVVKVFGQVSSASNEAEAALMTSTSAILVAKNSRISEGKPIKFVRRTIAPEIAQMMGATVDKAQRAIFVNPTPVNVSGTNTLAYGVLGYESVIFCVTNPRAIVNCDLSGKI
jgi:hypothetical protein